ncbi:MAG: carbohydrate ABC transporter permease [Anaerocolumna sp.]
MNRTRKKGVLLIVCFLISMVSILPIIWAILTSFKTYIETQAFPLNIFAKSPNFNNYIKLFTSHTSVLKPLMNSFFVSMMTTIMVLVLAIPAAYSLARFKTKSTQKIQMWIIGLRMTPLISVLLPYYILFSKIGLTNNRWGLIILYVMSNVTFAVWLLTVFFEGLPVEVEEAARVDGLSYFSVLRKMVIPLAANSILIIAAFVFIFSWNELIFAMNLTGTETQTLPVILSTYASDVSVQYQMMTATQIIQIIPVAVITLLIQKNILTGLSFGAVKG